MIRFGIIGLGNMGIKYANWLYKGEIEGAKLCALTTSTPGKKTALEEQFKEGVAVYTDYEEMLQSQKIDAVIIATPHYYHPQMAISALNQGIHTLIEKPAGIDTLHIKEMNEVAKRAQVQFGIMMNQRTNPLYKKAKELVEVGAIGMLTRSEWIITNWWRPQVYFESSPWRGSWEGEGGGVLINQALHQIDLWQWICGMPIALTGKANFGWRRKITTEDQATILAVFENGATGTFTTCTHDLLGVNRLEISGTKGKLTITDGKELTIEILAYDESYYNEKIPATCIGAYQKVADVKSYSEKMTYVPRAGESYHEVIGSFAKAISGTGEMIAHGEEGIKAVEMINALYLAEETKAFVNLPIDDEAYQHLLAKKIKEEQRNKSEE